MHLALGIILTYRLICISLTNQGGLLVPVTSRTDNQVRFKPDNT